MGYLASREPAGRQPPPSPRPPRAPRRRGQLGRDYDSGKAGRICAAGGSTLGAVGTPSLRLDGNPVRRLWPPPARRLPELRRLRPWAGHQLLSIQSVASDTAVGRYIRLSGVRIWVSSL